MEENANKLHFKCTNFNFSTRVTVCAECIYDVLTEYLKYLSIRSLRNEGIVIFCNIMWVALKRGVVDGIAEYHADC